MVNTDVDSAFSTDVMCSGKVKDSDMYDYILQYDKIEDVVMKANTIRFAVPMQNAEFKAISFSLKGSTAAINFLQKLFIKGSARDGSF